ncbi:hypothetical protein Mgra_00007961 [Meloidogyne graminicola]|uniref:Uncharacterized protein n=1 Tax=Meloidogyne graminicola TaxID=189291 RepID=A0A8S9ZH71_9BILA|nr:hypothetical protein Mgra_00007961 [Meloidogyne graminicola]
MFNDNIYKYERLKEPLFTMFSSKTNQNYVQNAFFYLHEEWRNNSPKNIFIKKVKEYLDNPKPSTSSGDNSQPSGSGNEDLVKK